jgi:hypothetical protein
LNLAVLPWWALWIALPRSRWALSLASHGLVFTALAVVYLVFLVCVAVAGGLSGGLDFEGVRGAISTAPGLLAGWTHFLALDLFAGAWILRESRRLDLEPRFFLLLTLLAGPLGLGAFLLRRWLRLRSFGQLGDRDLV